MSVAGEQEKRQHHAGEPATYRGLAGGLAARRLVTLLVTSESVKLGFDREKRAVVLLEIEGENPGGWKPGDHVLDYPEAEAIKAIVDRAEDEWQGG